MIARLVDIFSIFLFICLLVTAIAKMGLPFTWWGLATSFFAADILSGYIHWLGDTFGDEDMAIVGPYFLKPFRHHHVASNAITEHDFLETNGNTCLLTSLLLMALLNSRQWLDADAYTYLSSFILPLSTILGLTNQFHKWAHMEKVPKIIKILQKMGLILSPQRHHLHHQGNHNQHFCISSGITNQFLERIRFFSIQEKKVRVMIRLWRRFLSKET